MIGRVREAAVVVAVFIVILWWANWAFHLVASLV